MTRFDAQLLKSLHRLALMLRGREATGLLQRRRLRFPGGGTEVAGLRDYAPGDEFRNIDWKICARRDEILSKVFAGRDDRPLYVLVDCSASMGLGNPAKLDVARRIAAMLGYVALWKEDRVGGISFSGRMVTEISPMCGREQIPRWLRFVEQIRADDRPTSLAAIADRLVRRRRRAGPAIVISDLFDPAGFEKGLGLLRRGSYEPRVVQLYDRADAQPCLLGDMELFDVELDQVHSVRVTERALREYHAAFARFLQSVRTYCVQRGLPSVQLSTALPLEQVYRSVLGLGQVKPHAVAATPSAQGSSP